MTTKTKLERLAERYDTTDTASELQGSTAAGGTDKPPAPKR